MHLFEKWQYKAANIIHGTFILNYTRYNRFVTWPPLRDIGWNRMQIQTLFVLQTKALGKTHLDFPTCGAKPMRIMCRRVRARAKPLALHRGNG